MHLYSVNTLCHLPKMDFKEPSLIELFDETVKMAVERSKSVRTATVVQPYSTGSQVQRKIYHSVHLPQGQSYGSESEEMLNEAFHGFE